MAKNGDGKEMFVPSPDKYINNFEWCGQKADGACRPKGAFFKDKRITATDRIYQDELREPKPAANKYENLEHFKN